MSFTTRVRTRLRVVKTAAVHGTGPDTVRRDDMTGDFWALHRRAAEFTMTTPERLFALRNAVHHIAIAEIPGDIVECGVWRGGSAMMAALAMRETGDRRTLWLYDTVEG